MNCRKNTINLQNDIPIVDKKLDKYEDTSVEERNRELKNEFEKLKNKNYSKLIDMKESYANKIFIFICSWSCFVILILFFQGFNFFCFKLSDISITTLIGTSFIEVLGLMYIVLNHIFPK